MHPLRSGMLAALTSIQYTSIQYTSGNVPKGNAGPVTSSVECARKRHRRHNGPNRVGLQRKIISWTLGNSLVPR
eukprot:366134-Chlamydomonas_euryale.AAC.10